MKKPLRRVFFEKTIWVMEDKKEKKRRFYTDRILFWIGMSLACSCLAVGLFLKYEYRLEKPTFLESRRISAVFSCEEEEQKGWHADLELGYITGEKDKRTVQYLEFPELGICPDTGRACAGFVVLGEDVTRTGLYSIHVMSGRVECSGKKLPEAPVTVTRGIVTYSDGSREEVDMGEILLAPEGERDPYAGEIFFSSNSAGQSSMDVEIKDAVTLTVQKIEGAREKASARLFINNVPAEDISSLDLEKGDMVHIEGNWDQKKARFLDRVVYGETGLSSLLIFSPKNQPENSFSLVFGAKQPAALNHADYLEVWKYLRERGAF